MNVIDVKNIKEVKMKVKRLAFVLLSILAFSACNNDPIDPGTDPDGGGGTGTRKAGNISLKIYVPKGSISTYASEDATAAENRIDTLYVDLWQSGTLIESDTFKTDPIDPDLLQKTNDSTWTIKYDVDGLTQGTTITARVYANRKKVKIIANGDEIAIPSDPATSFLMTGEGEVTYNGTVYTGTVHIVRDVAKLRINVSKDAVFLPADLGIDYSNIKIRVLNVANQTSLFLEIPTSQDRAAGEGTFAYIDYDNVPRAARLLAPFNLSTGGQVDSCYLNENYRSTANYNSNTTTQVEVTIPTLSASEGNKTDSYTYTLRSNNSYDILRNYIYTLNIKVRGQSLEPLISLNMRPWDDINLDGSILGTYLTMRTSEIEFDEGGYAEVAFCTDAQAVYVDYTEYNNANPTAKIGDVVQTVGIQPADPNLTPDYQGQVLVDKRVCTSFGFKIDTSVIKPHSLNLSGKICIKAGNIKKCISFVGQRIYDAHYIVGEDLLNAGELFTSATVATESGSGWLEVSRDRLYTSNASPTGYTGTAVPLYLHLDENLTGNIRKGSVTVLSNNVEKKIYIQQLPAIPIGRFGYNGAGDAGLFPLQLYTEQFCEHGTTTPKYRNPEDSVSFPINNNIYNGLEMARSTNFDGDKYKTAPYFNWQAAVYQAINYCAYKNRPATKGDGTMQLSDIKWYLPSQAQLMAMWVTYESYKNEPYSNFKTDSYWSSTNNVRYPYTAQYLNFKYGNVGHNSRSTQYLARCVRSEGATTGMVTVSGTNIDIGFKKMPGTYTTTSKGNGVGDDASPINATLYDSIRINSTNNGTDKTWTEALTICSTLGAGWRLPTQRELQVIWILNPEIRSLNVSGFTNFADDYYWTATESSNTPSVTEPNKTDAFMIYMGSSPAGDAGNTPHIVKTHKASVRCVREL